MPCKVERPLGVRKDAVLRFLSADERGTDVLELESRLYKLKDLSMDPPKRCLPMNPAVQTIRLFISRLSNTPSRCCSPPDASYWPLPPPLSRPLPPPPQRTQGPTPSTS